MKTSRTTSPESQTEASGGETDPDSSRSIDRREFLQQTGAAALGLGALGLAHTAGAAPALTEPASIKRYVELGKTGLEISDIGFGSGACKNADLVRHCFDRGVNYFDTAEWYKTKKGEYVERFVGEGLKGVRDKVVITTKYMAQATDDRNKIMHELEQSLRRLQTDHVDIFLNHAVNELARMKNPEWMEFVELAKQQGKIRFSGMSGHGGNLQSILDYVLDRKMVDVILVAHNFGSDPAFYEKFTRNFDIVANQKGLPRLMKKAHDQGVGVIVMKTLMGGRLNDLSEYRSDGARFYRGAFRWVFSDPNVDALIISMVNEKKADKFIACSGDPGLEKADIEVLKRYVAAVDENYCRNDCKACVSSCPYGVPIADVLRQKMYSESYGDLHLAQRGYAGLGAAANPCLSCANQSCANACPYGIDIPKLTRKTARMLG